MITDDMSQVYIKTMLQKNGYLKEAKRILTYAKKEYSGAKKSKNEMKARQAAEKGYLCLLKTINALFVAKGAKKEELPEGERGRRYFLVKYADKDSTGSKSGFRKRYF